MVPPQLETRSAREALHTVEFPGRPASVTAARDLVRSALATATSRDDAVLCVSELASNAVKHSGGGPYRVMVLCREDRVYLAVADSGGGKSVPHLAGVGGGATSGRGLTLVSSLASAWGYVPMPGGGWRVWCELPMCGSGR